MEITYADTEEKSVSLSSQRRKFESMLQNIRFANFVSPVGLTFGRSLPNDIVNVINTMLVKVLHAKLDIAYATKGYDGVQT